mgnify:CR=1 FL=1
MSFFNRNKNQNSSMYFISDFEDRIGSVFGSAPQGYAEPFSFKKLAKRAAKEMEHETYEIDGIDNNIIGCNGRCERYAKIDSWKLQELMAQSGLSHVGNEIKNLNDLPSPIYNSKYTLITGKYKVRVNKAKNVVIVYEKGDDGKYEKSVRVMNAVVGRDIKNDASYNISNRWLWIKNPNGSFSKFVTQVAGNVVFESIGYKRKEDLSSLNYIEFDNLGNSIDGSFIKLQYADAQWIFDNLDYDTVVEFYESDDLNVVNVPEVKKISLENDKKNWDPTYNGSESPWNKVKNDGKKK